VQNSVSRATKPTLLDICRGGGDFVFRGAAARNDELVDLAYCKSGSRLYARHFMEGARFWLHRGPVSGPLSEITLTIAQVINLDC
jgi:hypothetical protein